MGMSRPRDAGGIAYQQVGKSRLSLCRRACPEGRESRQSVILFIRTAHTKKCFADYYDQKFIAPASPKLT